MPIMVTKLAAVFFLSLSVLGAGAQQLQYTNQQRYGVKDGLPQSFISGITQDKDGFIWLSTLDGLSRYDGRGFKNFRHRNRDTASLSANAINFLLPQADNSITLIYDGFLVDEFDMQTTRTRKRPLLDKLKTIPEALWKLYNLDNLYNGRDWVFLKKNYKGIGWLNSSTGEIKEANKANGLLKEDSLSAFLQTADGRIFLVSENGVQVSDTAKTGFEFIAFPTTIAKVPLKTNETDFLATRTVLLTPANKLIVFDWDRVVLLDLPAKKTISYPIPNPVKSILDPYPAAKIDSRGQFYFKHRGRIFRMAANGEMKLLWENTIAPDLHISAFYIDRSDVLWVSVNAQGLIKVNLQALPFQSYAYKNSFVTDVLQQAGVPVSQIPRQWSDHFASYYFRSSRNSRGDIYLSCNYYNFNKFYLLGEKKFQPVSLPEGITSYSALTVSPADEVLVFDEKATCWYSLLPGELIPGKKLLDKTAFKDVMLADACFAGDYLWLSTYSNGLFQLRNNKVIAKFEGKQKEGLLPKELTEICSDPADKERFWIGSRGGGLILWHAAKGLQKVYTTENGLPNNTIYCILPDKKGRIWCSTNKGIFRLDPVTEKITAFEEGDGLAGNEFNRAHKFLFPDGRMAFGGLEGFTVFNPADFEEDTKTGNVPVLLTSLQINNQPQDFLNPESQVQQPLALLQNLELPYDRNYLRFEFAAMVFNQPQKTNYRYRLVGADNAWIENGTSNVASYAGLPPGKYTLQLNATDNNGQWSGAVRELSIIIHPPFWATWWAYLVYALIAAALARAYFIFREKRIRAEQMLAFEKKEALRLREMEEVKDRFFSNITHEFRTPLTLIITPLEKLSTDPTLSMAALKQVETAQKNSRQLLRLINEFLDISKLNSGQMSVERAAGDLSVFITDLVQAFEGEAVEKGILFTFTLQRMEGLYLFDAKKWEKILVNLLSNALKFTPRDGTVTLLASGDDERNVRIEVSNSGPGIPLDQQNKVFDRFYQVNDESIPKVGGTGIGLSLAKELTELMKGKIHLVSDPGERTTITVTIPVEKAGPGEMERPQRSEPNLASYPVTGFDDKLPLLLIAEDNEELRHFLVESLEQRFRMVQAGDGITAWNMILEEMPDVIISDVMMPGQDGFDLCHQCKTDIRTSHICFILLTSKTAHDNRMKGLGAGADDYLTKPFHLAELELRTINLLQQQAKTRSHLQNQLLSNTPQQQLPDIQDEFLKTVYQEMELKLDNPELSVDYLSKAMAMSRSTLNRKLKTLLDISTNELIRQYRLQRGASFLQMGMDVSSVTYKVGFSSPSYFSQCFREQYGVTPSEYGLKTVVNRR